MRMQVFLKIRIPVVLAAVILLAQSVLAQTFVEVRSFEYAEDGTPVLVKNLPGNEDIRNRATFTTSIEDLRQALGERPVFDLIDFSGGTEAVTAAYPAGKLLIVEYATPQVATEADLKFRERLGQLPAAPAIYYRRIGNYGAFVFDSASEEAANALLDQIKYQKVVQWLGEDPNYQQKVERYFAVTTANIFLSTVLAIVIGIGVAVFSGIVAGLLFYRIREQRRATTTAYSDAGGMIRLNLDELTQSGPEGLLGE